VLADTLDLQDQDNPSAAEHQKHPHNGLAPHQASQLHHVIEERHSEEQSLQDAWNMAGNLTEEPGAIDEAQANHDHDHATNGAQQDGEEGAEGGESEAEGDDDMMDRISSSPSIDDGRYLLPLSLPCRDVGHHTDSVTDKLRAWSTRIASASPMPEAATPMHEDLHGCTSSDCSTAGSSPFVHSAEHLPLDQESVGDTPSPLSMAPG
jgi:hypothetical protein